MKRMVSVVIVIGLALVQLRAARADAAPPAPAPGDSIQTGYIDTKVQMVSEDVLITAQDDLATVKATFLLRNQGTAPESFNVRFPVGADDGDGNPVTVTDFAAFVDNQPATLGAETAPIPYCGNCQPIPWATWPVTFPPGQTLSIDVIYAMEPSYNGYIYILETGAGWYGNIGQGVVTFRLPYAADHDNIRFREGSFSSPFPEGYTISGTDVVWQFTDLEPTSDNNIQIKIMPPAAYREWKAAEIALQQAPDSLDAHLRMGRALVGSINLTSKGDLICEDENRARLERAKEEYQYILQAAPEVGDYWAEYLEVLEYYALGYCPDSADYLNGETCHALERASQLAPDHPVVKYTTDNTLLPDICESLAAQATNNALASANPAATLTEPAAATFTPETVSTSIGVAAPSATPGSTVGGPSMALLGAGGVVLLMMLFGGWLMVRRRAR